MARLWIACIIAWTWWISASFGSVQAAPAGRLLAGSAGSGAVRFLVGRSDGVDLVAADGKVLRSFPGCTAVDVSMDGTFALCFPDRMLLVTVTGADRTMPLAARHPLLDVPAQPVRLHLWAGRLLVLPEPIPRVINPDTDAVRSIPGLIAMGQGRIQFRGAEGLYPVVGRMVFQEGRQVLAVDPANLEPRWSVALPPQRMLRDARVEEGGLGLLLDRGYHWRVHATTGKRLVEDRLEQDEDALVAVHHGNGGPWMLRATVQETGALAALSAWKKGRMTALISVEREGREAATREVVFSIDRISTFTFQLERFPDGMVLHLRDQDVFVLAGTGGPVIRTAPVSLHAIPVAGTLYRWDADTGRPVPVP